MVYKRRWGFSSMCHWYTLWWWLCGGMGMGGMVLAMLVCGVVCGWVWLCICGWVCICGLGCMCHMHSLTHQYTQKHKKHKTHTHKHTQNTHSNIISHSSSTRSPPLPLYTLAPPRHTPTHPPSPPPVAWGAPQRCHAAGGAGGAHGTCTYPGAPGSCIGVVTGGGWGAT